MNELGVSQANSILFLFEIRIRFDQNYVVKHGIIDQIWLILTFQRGDFNQIFFDTDIAVSITLDIMEGRGDFNQIFFDTDITSPLHEEEG